MSRGRATVGGAAARPLHVLFLVENLSVPSDDRVWREARVARDAGYAVSVCCPTGSGPEEAAFEDRDGIAIHRFARTPEGAGLGSLVREYVVGLVRLGRLMWRVDRRARVDVVHVANPPDLLVPLALALRLRHRTRIVYDQHDLVPELVATRFPSLPLGERLARSLERVSHRLADAVVVANERFAEIASARGGVPRDRIAVVRNAPDLGEFTRGPAVPELKRGKRFLAVYVGVMGPQDGVDHAVRAVAHLAHEIGRTDLHVAFVGDGSERAPCERLAHQLRLAGVVEFVGWQERRGVLEYLATADVALAPDPRNPLNDRSSMIKVVEYMTIGLPIVAFDLPETVATAGGAAVIVPGNDHVAFAQAIDGLLRDPGRRARLAAVGHERARGDIGWDRSRRTLAATYGRLETAARPPDGDRARRQPEAPRAQDRRRDGRRFLRGAGTSTLRSRNGRRDADVA